MEKKNILLGYENTFKNPQNSLVIASKKSLLQGKVVEAFVNTNDAAEDVTRSDATDLINLNYAIIKVFVS